MHLTVPRSWPEQPRRFPQVNFGTRDELPLSEMAMEDRVNTFKKVDELLAREAVVEAQALAARELARVTPEQTPPVGQPVKAEAPLAPKAPPPVPLPPAPAAGSA